MHSDMLLYDRRLDVSGLHCPVPVIHCRAQLTLMAPAETLYIVGTDADLEAELARLAERFGHARLKSWRENGRVHLLLQKNVRQQAIGDDWLLRLARRLGLFGRGPRRSARQAGLLA
ncbi:sulfurtransferase TusA family protein [Thiohalobacter sp. IOR34]|uniref:sulfurtransferase TusA family protein n=1 Tax=Thiohalobacter sp. IOR34 TaxID=3057176 RepID=UPI0025B25EA4|nr:sulfurtransferase TusA family protein [Thiohalobacter sp. IOR34]WJW76012.1 sulfurtransferase TusA family protein [Thiohalobacter sp. IOR34]